MYRVAYIFLICCTLFAPLTFSNAGSGKPMKFPWETIDALQALTQEEDWLNISRPLTKEDLKGRLILVDFWTYCCINCIHVIPDLIELKKQFGDDLTVIGVHSAKFANERDRDNIRKAMLRYDVEHPVVNDDQFKIWKDFSIKAWPTQVLIDEYGNVFQTYQGEGNIDRIRRDIIHILSENKEGFNIDPLPMSLEKDKEPAMVLNFPGKLRYVKDYKGDEVLFVSDSGHNRIVGMRLDGQIFVEIGSGKKGDKDGDFATAEFNKPQGVLYKDNILYVADTGNHKLRKIDLVNKTVTTIAGTGKRGVPRIKYKAKASQTALASPWDLAFYPDENNIAIAMAGTHQLWVYKLLEDSLYVTAGTGKEWIDDGKYPLNSLSQPSGLSVVDDVLFFVDAETSALRAMQKENILTLIGTGLFDYGYAEGKRGVGKLQHPVGVSGTRKKVYIADSYNHSIRYFDLIANTLHNYSGNGTKGTALGSFAETRFNEPNDVVNVNGKLYVADTNNHRILMMDKEKDLVTALQVIPKPSGQRFSLDMHLPNLSNLSEIELAAGRSILLNIRLEKGWKINTDAPSWVSLFIHKAEGIELVRSYRTEKIKELQLRLPALTSGETYTLQGTFYYCEDKEGALCLIKSFSQDVAATINSKQTELSVRLRDE